MHGGAIFSESFLNVCFRYAKGHDPDNWLSIDEETAEIKLTKVPDRESKFLVNGTYIAKIICMTQGKNISVIKLIPTCQNA